MSHACVVADADYGDNPAFLNELDTRGEHSVVAVRANFSVVTARKADAPLLRADELLHALPRWRLEVLLEQLRP